MERCPAGFNAADFAIQTSVANQVNLVVGATNVLFWDGAKTVANGTSWTAAAVTGTLRGPIGPPRAEQRTQHGTVKFAVFSGAAGTVTLKENVSTTGMQFTTDGYTIGADPGKAITLTGAATFRVDPGVNATVNAPLTGAGSLTKLDVGTFTLSGANTYTGGTTVVAGVLMVTESTGAGLGSGAVTVNQSRPIGIYAARTRRQ